ncbi:flagellar hook-associated protein FlgK [bacterium]|nr:flagellar hook-associated protein FlgK [bacterium]
MLGLFGTLNLGARSLQTQQQGVEVSGHNLANVNNPAYARQRIIIQAAGTIPDPIGPQGTGAETVAIRQIRNALVDRQLASEISVTGSLESQQQAFQYAQADLGQQIDRTATGAEGAAAAQGVGGQNGIADYLNGMFSAWQSLSTDPSSLAERQVLILKAQSMTTQFNQVDRRLADLHSSLNDSVQSDVDRANTLLKEIAQLNDQIAQTEQSNPGSANDLRDTRLARIEDLSKLVNVQQSEQASGAINLSIDGNLLVSESNVMDTLQNYDDGTGSTFVQLQTAGTPLNITGGSIAGTISARDGGVQSLRDNINNMAAQLITEVNSIYQAGYSLNGATGQNFFTGTNAGDIGVNSDLLNDPSKMQVSADPGAVGDNSIAVSVAQLANKKLAALSGQTLSENYSQSVATLGQNLSLVNDQLGNQNIVESMIRSQRDSISGVSLDEEMTNLMQFQRAYQASARLISTVDTMLDTVLNMKR